MTKKKLANAISMLIAGSAISFGASAATTMYNTFTTTATSATDGWNYIYDGTDADTIATGPESKGHLGTAVPWIGTSGGTLPFGYTGSAHLNWAIQLNGGGDSAQISAADSTARYSATGSNPDANYVVPAEIDTGAGAWKDNTGTGWKHQTDIGVIRSDVDTYVRINLSTLGGVNNNFGVTVFTGMDTTTGDYSHHGGWNNATKPETTSNPWYGAGVGSGMTYLTHDATVDSTNYIEFFAQANQEYTLALGGNGVGRWNENVAGYTLNVSSVPVPAAVWLFGSAITGLIGLNRRRRSSLA